MPPSPNPTTLSRVSGGDNRIYLASRSPRRRELLKQIGVSFESLLVREDLRRGADVDETPLPDESAGIYVLRIARAKANIAVRQIALRGLPQKPVLAADTTIVFDDHIIGKPEDGADAARLLRALSGREHQVLTAVVLALREQVEAQISVSSVWFRDLAEAEIRRYIASGEPLDKAGAYAIQGRGAAFVARIEGSYSGIMGLPLAETADLLQRFNIPVL
jgi:septum formation protein